MIDVAVSKPITNKAAIRPPQTNKQTEPLTPPPHGGTGVSGLTRELATLPQGGSRSLRWSEIRMEDPQEDPLAVHCFCVCSGSVLLGDHLGVSRSRERDLLSVLFNYPRLFVYVQCVSSHSFSLFYSAINFDACSLLWFSCLYLRPPPLPFGRICFVVLVMRKRGESS